MFGFGKTKIATSSVTKNIAKLLVQAKDDLSRVPLIRPSSITSEKRRNYELNAFIYVLGWFSIQASRISGKSRHLLSAGLVSSWSDMVESGENTFEFSGFCIEMMKEYNGLLANANDEFQCLMKLYIHFQRRIGCDSELVDSVQFIIAALPHIDKLKKYTTDMDREYSIHDFI